MMDYYIDTLPGDIHKNSPHKFDKNGVILSKIPYTQDYHYHVTSIASYAIQNMDKDKIFMSQTDWLENNIEKDGSFVHRFKLPFYDFETPWIGGLSQGLAISAFIRAYHKTQDKKYLKLATKSFNSLKKNCLFTDSFGHTWIEEYPGVPSILNGFVYALFGVYDVKDHVKDAEKLWKECIKTLIENLPRYDLKYWSRYDLETGIPATTFYHYIHQKQMYALYNLTLFDIFEFYCNNWADGWIYSPRIKLLRIYKIIERNGIIGTYKKYKQRKRWLQ